MTNRQISMLLVQAMLLAFFFSPASSRPWKPTHVQVAQDYATIQHQKSKTDSVMIRWWAQPTATPGTTLATILEKYVVISVVQFHVNPDGTMSFDDVATLDALDSSGHPLTRVPENALVPIAAGVLSGVKAAFRQSVGPNGRRHEILYVRCRHGTNLRDNFRFHSLGKRIFGKPRFLGALSRIAGKGRFTAFLPALSPSHC